MASLTSQLTNMQNATNKLNFERGQARLGQTSLDKDAFLQLLMVKLQNQDPLNPTSNDEMFQQQAQLASLEQLQNLNKSLSTSVGISQASSVVGKQVELLEPNGNHTYGRVESVTINDNELTLRVNGQQYSMNAVKQIYADTSPPPSS